MEKIKIKTKTKENIKKKFNGVNIELKPYISTEDLFLINDICASKIRNDINNLQNSIVLRTLFDICVTELCTSISLDGVKGPTKKNKNIEIDFNPQKFLNFDFSGIRELLQKNIVNYDIAWQTVWENIQLLVTRLSLIEISANLPSEKDLEKSITSLKQVIEKINKDDPKMFNKIVETAKDNNAFKIAQKTNIKKG